MNYQKQWEFLKNKFEAEQLAHAYLFSGQDIAGINLFAKEFIKSINSLDILNAKQQASLIDNENFPDLMVVKSIYSKSSVDNEKDMMEIDISQIREVNNFLSYKSYYGGYKTVVVHDAHRMNVEAQSSFLKTLEEPKGKTLIILISSKPEALLNTITSRCQEVTFFLSQKEKLLETEQVEFGELLTIINSDLATKFQYAKKVNLEGDNFNNILYFLQKYFRKFLLIEIGALKGEKTHNYSLEKLKNIIRLIENINYQTIKSNLNNKLALEVLLLEI